MERQAAAVSPPSEVPQPQTSGDTASSPTGQRLYDTASVVKELRSRRKARTTRSCFPCRHRKVRCDGRSPCSNCLRRDHAALCRIVPDRARSPASASVSCPDEVLSDRDHRQLPPRTAVDVASRLADIQNQMADLARELRHLHHESSAPVGLGLGDLGPDPLEMLVVAPEPPESKPPESKPPESKPPESEPAEPSRSHFLEDATGAVIFLGPDSDSPLVMGCRDFRRSEPDCVEPKAFIFENLWAPAVSLSDVAQSLPNDSDIIRYWQIFENFVHPFYPALVVLPDFRTSVFDFLDDRTAALDSSPLLTPSWLGLLFSVLACGVQFSDDAIATRDLRSKVFVCSSFQCLRTSGFLSHTDVLQIQAMALIGQFLRNNLDTNAAWMLTGSTIRLAQSIGLHSEELPVSPPPSPASSGWSLDSAKRRQLWWMLIWQDTFLSLAYDRPPSSLYPKCTIPSDDSPDLGGRSFVGSVLALCQVTLDRARQANLTGPGSVNSVHLLNVFKGQLDAVTNNAAPFLTSKHHCKTLQDHLQRLALRIHVGYCICRLYRLGLDYNSRSMSQATIDSLVLQYSQHATDVLKSFLDMHRLSSTICRSWAFAHNVASSAIPLQRLASLSPALAHELNGELGPLIQRLIEVLDGEQMQSQWYDPDTNMRHFGPYSRVARALKETFNPA